MSIDTEMPQRKSEAPHVEESRNGRALATTAGGQRVILARSGVLSTSPF